MRRVWFDSAGDAWIAEWNAGQLGRYEPDTGEWSEWALPGADPPRLRGLRRRSGARLADRFR